MISDIITIDNQGRGFDNALEEGRQKYPIKAGQQHHQRQVPGDCWKEKQGGRDGYSPLANPGMSGNVQN
ncbi:MAG: hypothetical protein IJI59_07740 [Clostridia bacterium]|nr:hypothetical protein [Clostridia bacterium]